MGKLLSVLAAFAILFGVYYIIDSMKEESTDTWLPVDAETYKQTKVDPVANWINYTANTGKFVVSLPLIPQYATDTASIPHTSEKSKYDMYVAQSADGDIFTITSITYPEKVKTPPANEIMNGIVKEMKAAKAENRINKMTSSTYNGYPAYDFQLENKNTLINGKEFMIDHTLYVLTMIDLNKDANPLEFDHFISSFSLLPSSQKAPQNIGTEEIPNQIPGKSLNKQGQ